MQLESHLTLSMTFGDEPSFRAWAASRSLKVVCIELPRGTAPRQVMLTLRGDPSLESARARAEALAREVQDQCGARATRLKVEMAWDAAPSSAPLYLEHHVRAATHEPQMLVELAHVMGAHLSRNAYRVHASGLEERFLTQRFAAGEIDRAARALEALLAALRRASIPVTKVERERVIFDDNLSLDDGWMERIP